MIARTVLRLLTKLALEESAFEKGRAYDTIFAPFDKAFSDEEREPFAVIYTEKTVIPTDQKPPSVELVIDFVAGAYELQVQEGQPTLVFPASDAAAEMSCDVRGQRILDGLQELSGFWSDLWRDFVNVEGSVEMICGADARGIHRATRRMVFNTMTLSVPPLGEPLAHTWLRVVEAFEAHEQRAVKAVGALVRAMLEGKEPNAADWVQIEEMNLSRADVQILGLPHSPDWSRNAPATKFEIEAANV